VHQLDVGLLQRRNGSAAILTLCRCRVQACTCSLPNGLNKMLRQPPPRFMATKKYEPVATKLQVHHSSRAYLAQVPAAGVQERGGPGSELAARPVAVPVGLGGRYGAQAEPEEAGQPGQRRHVLQRVSVHGASSVVGLVVHVDVGDGE
jgi:hypothetical protein